MPNSSFGDRLEEERSRLGLKKGQMAEAGNVAPSTYTSYLQGDRIPDLNALVAWAEAGVDPLYVAVGRRVPDLLAPEEEMVLSGYRRLDARGRAGVLALIGGMQPQTNTSIKVQGEVGQYIDGDHTGPSHIDMRKGPKKSRR
ncbi:helix-turn-helix domain-containing protein [Ralstonia pickettii]|uniref:helix-turn-helix domain-containing protein n=1 Tax=Ralstonia TaxID=48736 RepID=UPI000469708F|nr:helix-turn-helix transcriptional regulator [Ralstonia pickettii]